MMSQKQSKYEVELATLLELDCHETVTHHFHDLDGRRTEA